MEDSFKLLEDKIERAAQRLKDFHSETASLRDALADAQSRARKAEKSLGARAGSDGGKAGASKEIKGLSREVEALRGEREEIRTRLGRLIELLDGLE